MAYENGTASDHIDLLERVKTFVTTNAELTAANQQWELLNTLTNGYQFKAPGLSTTESIFINIDTYDDVANDLYNWRVFGAVGFDASSAIHLQPESLVKALLLWNQPMPYWLVANGQRLMIVIKVSTVYAFAYLGKIYPYATPNQYPYPLLIAGTHKSVRTRWSDTGKYHTSIIYPQNSAGVFMSSGVAHELHPTRNPNANGNTEYANAVSVQPTHQGLGVGSPIHPNGDGSYNLLPFVLTTFADGGNVLGELDGIYWVSGIGNASENTITVDDRNFLIFQNVFRTDWKSYAAMELA